MSFAFSAVIVWSISGTPTAHAQSPGEIDPPHILSITKLLVKPGVIGWKSGARRTCFSLSLG